MRAFADKCTCITCCKNQQSWGTKMALKNPKYDSSYMIMMMLSIWLWHRTKAVQSWCVLQIVWRPSHPRWIMKEDDVNVVSSWSKELLCPASQPESEDQSAHAKVSPFVSRQQANAWRLPTICSNPCTLLYFCTFPARSWTTLTTFFQSTDCQNPALATLDL